MNIQLENGRPAEILLVEDNVCDVILTRESFSDVEFDINLHNVPNGIECMKFLRKEDEFADAPTPDIVLLDLNMPVMDGRATLAEIVKDDRLKQLPVVVLTTSDNGNDVLNMYKLRCSSYITKPIDFNRFQEIMLNLTSHWFTVVMLPPKNNPDQGLPR